MREVVKGIFTWLLSFFNVGLYVRDRHDIDSLIYQLHKFGLQEDVYELESIYLSLIINESIKSLMMFLSLMCLFLANRKNIVLAMDKICLRSKPLIKKSIRFLRLDKVLHFIKKRFNKSN